MRPWILAGLAALPSAAEAAHLADHLVITEVGINVLAEPGAEFVEINNPTATPIALDTYYLTDVEVGYWTVVNGNVTLGSGNDFLLRFPPGASIPGHGIVVVCEDSSAFLTEMLDGSLAAFVALPGSPQLFERTQDADAVPGMVIAGATATGANQLVFTNTTEAAILFHWDGASDLVEDVDMVVWGTSGVVPNKDAVSIDGPDQDGNVSLYADDGGNGARATQNGTADIHSLQRRHILEAGETDSGGNGITGHDETQESWLTGANDGWAYRHWQPGLPPVQASGDLADALSFLSPAATSSADASGTSDLAGDGTLTELYLGTIDSGGDAITSPDSLYVAVRGAHFASAVDAGWSAVFIDLDPGGDTGVRAMLAAGDELSDETGGLDFRLTNAGGALDAGFLATAGFDLAVGLVDAAPTADEQGFRTFRLTGSTSNFSFAGSVSFDAAIDALFGGAPGTSIAGSDGWEGAATWTTLTGSPVPPPTILAVAVAGTNGGQMSCNTLPENSATSFATPTVLDALVCFETATGVTRTTIGPESCNGVDDDCDGVIDDGVGPLWYLDDDGDGFGDPLSATQACDPPFDHVDNDEDCDDTSASIHPGAAELCNEGDDDCDTTIDEDPVDPTTWYLDDDGDGYGDPLLFIADCEAPADHVANGGDCDDADPARNPDATEACNGGDDDCDGESDEPGAEGSTTYFHDLDEDGWGDAGATLAACVLPDGYVEDDTDCDDDDGDVHPGATEVCNQVDDDCNEGADEAGASGEPTWYADLDDDGHGDAAASVLACAAPASHVASSNDCDDDNGDVHPGAEELCNDVDDDCDLVPDDNPVNPSTWYDDDDGDGFGDPADPAVGCDAPLGYVENDGDCDDGAEGRSPALEEQCDAADLDEDCDGLADDADASASGRGTYYPDADGDGSGELGAQPLVACDPGSAVATDGLDCDDGDPAVHPDAVEICDAAHFDEDCDGASDDDDLSAQGTSVFYADADGDGAGGTVTVVACAPPEGFVRIPGDCDDNAAGVHPEAEEIACNGADDDCDSGSLDAPDGDADGVTTCAGDCDDSDPQVFPGGDDVPGDQVDQDCDGDDAEAPVVDLDGDGAPAGWDCDDGDPAVFPEAEESCDDGVDNDCDGAADDEDAACGPERPARRDEEDGGGCSCNQGASDGLWLVALAAAFIRRGRRAAARGA